jgi:hypothetical protein
VHRDPQKTRRAPNKLSSSYDLISKKKHLVVKRARGVSVDFKIQIVAAPQALPCPMQRRARRRRLRLSTGNPKRRPASFGGDFLHKKAPRRADFRDHPAKALPLRAPKRIPQGFFATLSSQRAVGFAVSLQML